MQTFGPARATKGLNRGSVVTGGGSGMGRELVAEACNFNTRAALRLMRKLLRKQGFAPKLLVTDKLRSYASAFRRFPWASPDG